MANDRFRIDWQNLEPLPRKTQHGATREDLAARKFNMGKAKHKGRCHITNQKRRQIELEHQRRKAQKADAKKQDFRNYKARVAAYWRGVLPEHP